MLTKIQTSLFAELGIAVEREAAVRQLHKELADAGEVPKSFTGYLQNKLKRQRLADRVRRFGPYVGN